MNKGKNINRLALKSGAWYVIANFLTRGINFLITPIFTRLMTTGEYGDFSNFIAWQSLLLTLTTLDLYSTVSKAKFDYEDDLDGYLSSIAVSGTIFTGICYIVVLIFNDFFTEFFGMEMKYIHIIFLYLLVAPAINILQEKHRIYLKYKFVTLLTFTSTGLSVVCSLIGAVLLSDKLLGRILGQESVLIIVNFIIYIYLLYKGRKIKKEYIKYGISLAVPLIPHVLSMNILGTSDRIMIRNMCGQTPAAFYSLAYTCSMIPSILLTSLNQAMIPWLFQSLENKEEQEIKNVNKMYVLIFSILTIGTMFVSPELVLIFGGEKYKVAQWIVPVFIAGCGIRFIYTLYVNLEFYEKKTGDISKITISMAVLNLLLNYIFIKYVGYLAASYTTLFCYGGMAVLHFLNARRLGYKKLYDNKFNFLMMSILIIAMVVILIISRSFTLRIVVGILYMVGIGTMAWKNRKNILKLINLKR